MAFKKFFLWTKLTPNWYLLYFALATLDVVTVLLSFGLNIKLTNDYAESVALNRAWATRLSAYAELSLAAQAVNAPGNDVFDSHDPKAERAKMQLALSRFHSELKTARHEIEALNDANSPALLQDLAAIESAMNEMVAEASLIFGFFENNRPTEAGQRMATMDRRYARVNITLADLSKHVRTIQQTIFEAQLHTAQTLRHVEYAIVLLVGLMVFGALRYGNRIAQAMKQAEAERLHMETMKAEFVSVVSHELRTPLTSLLGTLRLIRQGVIPAAQLPGIPDAFRKRIFQKFAQADSSATRAKGGTGLGLAIAKQLIEAMHGGIGYDSTPGRGSTFFIDLPLCAPESKPDSAPNAGQSINSPTPMEQPSS